MNQLVKVEFLTCHRTVKVKKGRTILDVAREHAIPVQYECDGKCTCGTCYVWIQEGQQNLSPVTPVEKFHLEHNKLPSNARLTCQARILGDVQVELPSL